MANLFPSKSNELVEQSEINVTPFIDVMLVLLIIFMVAAPLATVSVNVALPASNATAEPLKDEPLIIQLNAELNISVSGEAVSNETLSSELAKHSAGDASQVLYIHADKSVAYGDIMALLNTLRSLGYLNVALVGLDQSAS